MGDYFQPWRRRIGVIALVMACVFAVGLVRSVTTEDVFWIPVGALSSADQIIACQCGIEESPELFQWNSCNTKHWQSDWGARFEDPIYPGEGDVVDWFWVCGLAIGRNSFYPPDGHHAFLMIPYWLIILPLTLLSAYLLLRTPRTAPSESDDVTSWGKNHLQTEPLL